MLSSRLMVYVRVKPLTNDSRTVIDIVDDKSLVFDPIDSENQPTDEYIYHGRKFKTIGHRRNKNSSYTFDRVFDAHATNYHIYETVTRPMVDSTIDGVNCSVFAYGATGSGKTYTMLGSRESPGVIYFTSRDLFGKLQAISETDPLPAEIKICYFEIYNEKVRDLLVKEPQNFFVCGNKRLRTTPERHRARQQLITRDNYNLPVCDGTGDGNSLVIPDLTYHSPTSAEELIMLLESGNANRSQHPTDANADSSRSHAIFQIVLRRRTRRLNNSNGQAEYELQSSKMSLIDLAGSERASVAYRAGNDRSKNLQREGGNINKSLLALGNCINALADPHKGHKHIPFRNSKLTRLLRDSLGGSCRTAMIATVCQQPSHYDDTQNTLVYASRAKCIKLRPGRNFTDVAIQPKNYSIIIDNQNKQITTLQSQNDDLKLKLEDLNNELNLMRAQQQRIQSFNPHAYSGAPDQTPNKFLQESRYRNHLDQLYDERCEIRLALLTHESKVKSNELKLAFKKLDEVRQRVIHSDLPRINGDSTIETMITPVITSVNKAEQSEALRTQMGFFEKERRTLVERVNLNDMHVRDAIASMTTEFELQGYGTAEEFDAIIEPFICERERIIELEEKKYCEQHAYDIAQDGVNRLLSTESLLLEAAHVIRYTYDISKGRGLSDPLEAKISQLMKKFEGKKSVIWRDDNANQLLSVHENFSLHKTLHNKRHSRTLVSKSNYTPEQSNTTFDR